MHGSALGNSSDGCMAYPEPASKNCTEGFALSIHIPQLWRSILKTKTPNGELADMWSGCVEKVIRHRVNEVRLVNEYNSMKLMHAYIMQFEASNLVTGRNVFGAE